jgi:hypothetical protein
MHMNSEHPEDQEDKTLMERARGFFKRLLSRSDSRGENTSAIDWDTQLEGIQKDEPGIRTTAFMADADNREIARIEAVKARNEMLPKTLSTIVDLYGNRILEVANKYWVNRYGNEILSRDNRRLEGAIHAYISRMSVTEQEFTLHRLKNGQVEAVAQEIAENQNAIDNPSL